MLIILGVIEKSLKAELYCYSVWLDYYEMDMKRVIYVEEGIEKTTGMSTAYPIVDTDKDEIEIVGLVSDVWSALITVIVIGNIFLK